MKFKKICFTLFIPFLANSAHATPPNSRKRALKTESEAQNKKRRLQSQNESHSDFDESKITVKLEADEAKSNHLEVIKALQAHDLERIARRVRGMNNTPDNCVRLSLALLEYFRKGTLKEASTEPATTEEFGFFIRPADQPSSASVQSESKASRVGKPLISLIALQHFGHIDSTLFGHLLPYLEQPTTSPSGKLDFTRTYIDLTQEVYYPHASFTDLEGHLKMLAQQNFHRIAYGLIRLSRATSPGHVLVYLAKPDEVFFIEAQNIKYGRGKAIVDSFVNEYTKPECGNFNPAAFYIPIGPT